MSLTKQDILEILEHAKELGITSFKCDGVEVNFGAPKNEVRKRSVDSEGEVSEIVVPLSPFDDLTEEQVTYWHSPYYDILQAEKEAHQKEIENEKVKK